MFHAYAKRFDVMGNLENFLVFRMNLLQGLSAKYQRDISLYCL